MSEDITTTAKHPLPIPVPPRIPTDAVVKRKRTMMKKRSGELLSVSEWALKRLEERYGHEALDPTTPRSGPKGDDGG